MLDWKFSKTFICFLDLGTFRPSPNWNRKKISGKTFLADKNHFLWTKYHFLNITCILPVSIFEKIRDKSLFISVTQTIMKYK